MPLNSNTYVLLGPGRDEMPNFGTPGDHVAKSAHHALSPFRPTTLYGQVGPATIIIRWKWHI